MASEWICKHCYEGRRRVKAKLTVMEKIRNMGIGIVFVVIGILVAIFMIAWLLYKILI